MDYLRITIPQDVGTIASRVDPKSAVDLGYRVKSTLFEVFGPNVVRPWRLLGHDAVAMDVIGWVAAGTDVPAAIARATSFGIEAVAGTWEPRRDTVVAIDLMASPERTFSRRDHVTGKRTTTSKGLDVHGEDARDLLLAWFDRRLWGEGTGIGPVTEVAITSARRTQVLLRPTRSSRRRDTLSPMPDVRAKVEVVVDDERAFASFLSLGIGPLKHVGFGSVFPSEVLDAAA